MLQLTNVKIVVLYNIIIVLFINTSRANIDDDKSFEAVKSDVNFLEPIGPIPIYFSIKCVCVQGRNFVPPNNLVTNQSLIQMSPHIEDDFLTYIDRPFIPFEIHDVNENEIIVVFNRVDLDNKVVLYYYPSSFNASDLSMNDDQIEDLFRCQLIHNPELKIMNLQSSTIYTFCALLGTVLITPFHCKSHLTATPFQEEPWIDQEHDDIMLTSILVNIVLVTLLIGIAMIYLLKYRAKSLMLDSQCVVLSDKRIQDY